MPLKTRITEMFGIEHPIIMGGLTGAGTPELAAAVSNSGCLGFVCAHQAGSPERYLEWIKQMNKLTDKPWGVNLTILREFKDAEKYLDAIIASGVKIIETAGRNPANFIPRLKKEIPGCIIIHKCTSVRHSLSAIRIGADIISLDGFECAGHPGEDDVGNFVLQAVGAKKLTVPFICSGGVASGAQIAAALAMGADGVNIGTLYCCSKECPWPQAFKDRVIASTEIDTTTTLKPLRNTSRVFKNKTAMEINEIEKNHWTDLKYSMIAELMSGKRGRQAEKDGDADAGVWSTGQGIGLIDQPTETCAQITARIMTEAEACIRERLGGLLVSKM